MQLLVSPAKLLWMTWPIYALMALGVLLNPREWLPVTPSTAGIVAIPLLLPVLGYAARNRWRLEVTPDALLHHTLTRVERFEWARMGPVQTRWMRIGHLPVARTLWFPYPTDAPRTPGDQITARLGRRLLPVFGDRSLTQTAAELESWRTLTHPLIEAVRPSIQASAPGPRW